MWCRAAKLCIAYFSLFNGGVFAFDGYTESIADLHINYEETELSPVILHDNEFNRFLIPIKGLTNYNLKLDYLCKAAVKVDDVEYIDLGRLSGKYNNENSSKNSEDVSACKNINFTKNIEQSDYVKYSFDPSDFSLKLIFPPQAMEMKIISALANVNRRAGKVGENANLEYIPASGFYYNYRFSFLNQHHSCAKSSKSIISDNQLRYFFDKGFFSHNFAGTYTPKQKNDQRLIRLNSYFRSNTDEKNRKWQIGDCTTRAALWSSVTQFAGIQYSTEYALDPKFITYPLINYLIDINSPSTLTIKNNNMTIFSDKLGIGPFDLRDLLTTSGTGVLSIIRTDIDGNVQKILIPYYGYFNLLKTGLSDFSVSAGFFREQYGVKSNKYTNFISSGDYMYGVNDYWTFGSHIDSFFAKSSSSIESTIGITNLIKLGIYGIFSSSFASNLNHVKQAQQAMLGYQFSNKYFNFSSNLTFFGKNFSSTYSTNVVNKNKINFTFGLPINFFGKNFGNISTNFNSFVIQGLRQDMLVTTYGNSIKGLSMNGSFSIDLRNKKNKTITFSISKNILGQMLNINRRKKDTIITDYNLSGNMKIGLYPLYYGGMVSYENKKMKSYNVNLTRKFDDFDGKFYFSGTDQKNFTERADIAGSVVFMGGKLFMASPINGSLIMVKAGDIDNVPVKVNGNVVTATQKGVAFLTNITPNIPVNIGVEEKNLPTNAKFARLNANIITKPNSGAMAIFDVVILRMVSGNLVDKNGTPLSMDYTVKIDGVDEDLFVGYYGELYIENLPSKLDHVSGRACTENSGAFDSNTSKGEGDSELNNDVSSENANEKKPAEQKPEHDDQKSGDQKKESENEENFGSGQVVGRCCNFSKKLANDLPEDQIIDIGNVVCE